MAAAEQLEWVPTEEEGKASADAPIAIAVAQNIDRGWDMVNWVSSPLVGLAKVSMVVERVALGRAKRQWVV